MFVNQQGENKYGRPPLRQSTSCLPHLSLIKSMLGNILQGEIPPELNQLESLLGVKASTLAAGGPSTSTAPSTSEGPSTSAGSSSGQTTCPTTASPHTPEPQTEPQPQTEPEPGENLCQNQN